MNGLRIAALQSDKRWPDAVNSAVACLVGHGAVEVGAAERLDLSESLDITQRYCENSQASNTRTTTNSTR